MSAGAVAEPSLLESFGLDRRLRGLRHLVAMLRSIGRLPPRGALAFGHGVEHDLGEGLRLFRCYHPSQQNTFTGKLTAADLDAVLSRVRAHLGKPFNRRM